MTDDDPKPDRAVPAPDPATDAAELEASLLTALALGELSGAERDRVAARLAEPTAAAERRQVEELRALAAALRTARPAHAGSTALRAAVMAALGDGPSTTPAARSTPRRWPWLAVLGAVAASVAIAFVATRPVDGVRQVARRGAPAVVPAGPRVAAPTATPGARPDGAPAATMPHGIAPTATPLGAAAAAGKAIDRYAALPADQPARLEAAPAPLAWSDQMAAEAPRGGGSGGGGPGSGLPRILVAAEEHEHRQQALAELEVSVSPGAPAEDFGFRGRAAGGPTAVGRHLRAAESSAEKAERSGSDDIRARGPARSAERYARFIENPFLDPSSAPLSTFSIDVDTASYTIIRRFLTTGHLPPADAVRLEEMLNYFRYADPAPPADGDPFAVRLETAACPWRPGHRLLRVGIKGREIAAAARPAGNLVFLVDVSGSMRDANKLPLVKQALAMLVDQLREDDTVSIVTYAGDAGLKLPATGGHRPDVIRGVIDALGAGGSTHGSAGIEMAYDEAKRHFIGGGVNRVILCTDGDLNVGITDDEQLVKLIRARAAEGTFLTVLGFGQGNLQDEKMEKLADNGNGLYAYIDSVREARKVLIEQLTGSTVTIAKDVKIQVEFNPALVASYRLLGYENRVMAAQDFADDTKDAGEIGAGHGVTALYEYVPAGTGGATLPDLKYQPRPAPVPQPVVAGPAARELLTLKLRFKEPAGTESALREIPLVDAGGSFESASDDLRFAAAVAAFGMLLRSSDHAGTATLPLVGEIAAGALGADPGGLRAEFLDLVRAAGPVLPVTAGE